jgi:GGDEF domain-containing protein
MSLATITHDNNGIKVLSSATLINNKPDCYNCHDANNKFIGKLLVDFSTNKMDMMVSDNRNMLILSTIATILSSIFLSFVTLAVLIRKPLNRLLSGINDVKQGQRNVMDDIEGDDEISLLNRKFNSMVMAVYEYEQMIICNNVRERMTLASVCESLNLSNSGSVDEVSSHIIDAINIGFDVEKCAIMVINDYGDVRVQTALGLSEDETDVLRNYMEVVLSGEPAYSLHDNKIKRIKEIARRGEIFLSAGTANIVGDFLVVPLKVANTLRGAIIICAVKGEELNTPKLKELFAIVATSIAPHFHLSLSFDENKRMAKSPFNVFVDTIRTGIHNVEEYQMALSLVMLKIENYKEVCLISGSEDANLSIQALCGSLSASIKKVHTMMRITENSIALLLPMTDKEDAEELIKTVLATAGNKNLKVAFKIGSYPEDGDKAEDLICACS